MADTGPRGPQGPAGTSIDLPVAIANGGTGATTAAGARANLGLNMSVAKFDLEPSATAALTFNSETSAIIMCIGSMGHLYGTFAYNGYGAGGGARAHLTELQRGEALTYELLAESSNFTHGFTLANTNTANVCHVSVLVLHGYGPTFTTV